MYYFRTYGNVIYVMTSVVWTSYVRMRQKPGSVHLMHVMSLQCLSDHSTIVILQTTIEFAHSLAVYILRLTPLLSVSKTTISIKI